MKRLNITFDSEGTKCSAWLYLPSESSLSPVIVMAHGLGSVRGMRLDAFAERFCKAGYACFVFDYRHFGDSEGQPRQLLDVKKQLQDWKSALAYVRRRQDVDTNKVILWGTSFSGGHVLATAAQDLAVKAVISQCPFTDGLSSSFAVHPLTTMKLTPAAVFDWLGGFLGLSPIMVPTAAKPGAYGLMTAPDAVPGYLHIVPKGVGITFRNEVAARIALQIMTYTPGRGVGKIQCPILFCVCETDSVAPAKATLAHAKRAKQGQVNLYPYGHFDIYVGQPFERVVNDQLSFLARVVPV